MMYKNLIKSIAVAAAAVVAMVGLNKETYACEQGKFRGKLWVVSESEAFNVQFPPPSAIPDLTFSTNGIAYVGSSGSMCYTISSFTGGCETTSFGAQFSHLPNPYLGGVAGPSTPIDNVIIQLNGYIDLNRGDSIIILHDDGVVLAIDGVLVPGFYSGETAAIIESATFKGSAGRHSFNLLFANTWGNAVLSVWKKEQSAKSWQPIVGIGD